MFVRLIAIAGLIWPIACSPACGATLNPNGPPLVAGVRIGTASGEVVASFIEIADSREERACGLMDRTELGRDDGMLFVYEEPSTGTFWMKDTLIPLSIAFWGDDGRIHTISEMEPCEEDPCATYPADEPYTYALEMNAGWFDRNGIEVGDRADVDLLTY